MPPRRVLAVVVGVAVAAGVAGWWAAIARALLGDPALLLCDEPTGNLDRANTTAVLDLFDELRGQGVTLVVITRDDEVSARAARRVRTNDLHDPTSVTDRTLLIRTDLGAARADRRGAGREHRRRVGGGDLRQSPVDAGAGPADRRGRPVAGALVGLIAGLYPALRAARMRPVDALRSGT